MQPQFLKFVSESKAKGDFPIDTQVAANGLQYLLEIVLKNFDEMIYNSDHYYNIEIVIQKNSSYSKNENMPSTRTHYNKKIRRKKTARK